MQCFISTNHLIVLYGWDTVQVDFSRILLFSGGRRKLKKFHLPGAPGMILPSLPPGVYRQVSVSNKGACVIFGHTGKNPGKLVCIYF